MADKIIDKILWIEGFNPFSIKYNPKKAFEKHELELKTLEVDETAKSVFKYSNYFNSYFIDICEALNNVIGQSTLRKSDFIDLIISDINRTELIISEDSKQSLFSSCSFDSNMPANVYIKKPEFQNNSEPVWGLIDGAMETATLNLNYLNYVKFKKTVIASDELSQVDVIKKISLVGSTFNAIKQAYDRIIWRRGIIKVEDSMIKLKSNQRHLMLDNIALTRLIRNIGIVQIELQTDSIEYKSIRKLYHTTRHFQIIKSIEINADEIKLQYQAKSKKLTITFINFISPILTYYPFFQSEVIFEFDNLTILDLVNLFSLLCDFVMVLPIPMYDETEIKDLTKFRRFNPKVKKRTLKDYFKSTTKYSDNQISIFLSLLTQKGSKHDLFLYSIYEIEDYYFFSHSSIKRANMLYLVDKWLEVGKCDLAKRGYKFEDYIKNFLKTEKTNEFAKFKLIEQSKFSFLDENKNNVEEEIDLLIKTDNTLIIGEIKCSMYPLESKDFYSAYQTIKKAKKQVVRKAKFLEDNWDKFEYLLGEKGQIKIQRIIIINFPHFAGRIIDGIPIADFYLFLSYFKSGQLTNLKIEKNKGMTVNEIKYYDSIKSFEDNFSKFFNNPFPIEELFSRQRIEEYEVTLNGTEPKTIAERVVYIEKTPNDD